MQILDNHLSIENGEKMLHHVHTIEFDHVVLSYPNTSKRAINDVSFDMKFGEKAVLVSLNRSRKPTQIKLLLRIYDPDFGIIKINFTDIPDYSLSSLRGNFSVYFQEMHNYCFLLRKTLQFLMKRVRNPMMRFTHLLRMVAAKI